MKVVHVSRYYKIGGAAKAALRLHTSLIKHNIHSYFISIDENMPYQDNLINLRTDYKKIRNIHNRIFNKIKIKLPQIFKTKERNILNRLEQKKTEINAEFISHPFSNYKLEEHPIIKEADIVHLNWVSNEMLDYESFFRKCNKPIIWTLHDMNPFQGLFHYENDYVLNLDVINKLDDEILEIKKNAITNYKNSITYVTPSNWLAEKANLSYLSKNSDIITIPYGLDLEIFKAYNIYETRLSLDLPQESLVLLFIAESVNNPRKGFNFLLEALKNLNHENILIVSIGERPAELNDTSNLNIKYTGRLIDEKEIAKYYAASDAFILPSIEDNLPNVMLESLSCGTPVIAFPIGGIKEHIINGYNGILADEVTPNSLRLAIQRFINTNKTFDRIKIREYAISNFDANKNTLEYIRLYNKKLAESTN